MTELEAVRAELSALREMVQQLVQSSSQPMLVEFKEAARRLGVAPKTISRMVQNGELMPTLVRNKRLISMQELERVARPPQAKSSGASEERTRFDAAAALRRMAELKAKRR